MNELLPLSRYDSYRFRYFDYCYCYSYCNYSSIIIIPGDIIRFFFFIFVFSYSENKFLQAASSMSCLIWDVLRKYWTNTTVATTFKQTIIIYLLYNDDHNQMNYVHLVVIQMIWFGFFFAVNLLTSVNIIHSVIPTTECQNVQILNLFFSKIHLD